MTLSQERRDSIHCYAIVTETMTADVATKLPIPTQIRVLYAWDKVEPFRQFWTFQQPQRDADIDCFAASLSNRTWARGRTSSSRGGLPAPPVHVRRGPRLFGIADDGSMLGLPCLKEGAEVLEHPSLDDTASPLPTTPDTKSAGSDGIKIEREGSPVRAAGAQ